jgi:hypothetical protein
VPAVVKEGAPHTVITEFSSADYVDNARQFKATPERID